MSYKFEIKAKEFVERHEKRLQRILEIFPGFVVWMILLFHFWASFFWPNLVASFILIFMTFMFFKSCTLAIHILRGYRRIKRYAVIDWHKKYLSETVPSDLKWEDVRHCIVIPMATEPVEVIKRSVQALANQTMAKDLYIVLALEERVKDSHEKADILLTEFKHSFKEIWAEFHPPNLPGEVIGKSSNERWAAIKAYDILVNQKKIPLKNITLSSCDADAKFNHKFFEALTYHFAVNPNRYRRFWQSIVIEHNNINRVPSFVRIMSIFGGMYFLFEATEPRKLMINYSTYSTSLQLLHEVGYWDPDIIPEDWHIFLKSFFSLKGEVEVEPIAIVTTIDSAEAKTYMGALVNRYQQCRRHAWGVTLIPYVILQFFKHPEVPLFLRVTRVFRVIEGQILWSTTWFMITLSATIPPLVNPVFEQTVFGQNLPRITGLIMTFALINLFITIIIDARLRPPDMRVVAPWKRPLIYLEWLTLPIATLFMTALPGLHSQTSLMFGKYMEYKVMEKV